MEENYPTYTGTQPIPCKLELTIRYIKYQLKKGRGRPTIMIIQNIIYNFTSASLIRAGNEPLLAFVAWLTNLPAVSVIVHCTAGDEGPVANISCMNIFSHFQGLLTTLQLPATSWSAQIWIPC